MSTARLLRKFRKRLSKQKGPLRFTLNMLPTRDALLDPLVGPFVLEMLLECGHSAIVGGERECHGCAKRWSPDRLVAGVGIVEFLCHECWSSPDRLQIEADGFKRDLGLGAIETAVIQAGGRA